MSFKKGDEWIEADSEDNTPIRATVTVQEKEKKAEGAPNQPSKEPVGK